MIDSIKINISDPITSKAAELWGNKGQTAILQEECAEIITAISRYNRGRVTESAIAEEVADVIVCFQSVIRVLNIEAEVLKFIECKIARLKKRIDNLETGTPNLDDDIDSIQSSGGFTNE